jgi:phenylpropionate dioxygenase-like ring-hydroxylating dioxygenase large terminal subunit
MFVNKNRLPHVLSPRLYSCPEQYVLEIQRLFRPSWHIVGSVADAPKDGNFFTIDLLGTPLLIRNFQGTYHTFLNVCPHRHCMLTHEPSGHSPVLTCQYHGWEFNDDGSTGRIPQAQNFRPMPGGPECLQKFRTEVRGPLIFVSLNPDGASLFDQLGPLMQVCDEFPGDRWRQADKWSYDFPANWKVVVENTVEAYHVPTVHPHSLVSFGTEEEIEHELHPWCSIMRSPIVSSAAYRRISDWLLPILQPGCTHQYRLHHGFPHLFLIRIDAMFQVMTVLPTSPETCHLTVHVFTLRAAKETFGSRLVTRGWGMLKTSIVRRVLAEDARLYPDLQRGMKVSPFQGTISTLEELVYGFQGYVQRTCGLSSDEESG